MIGTSKKDDIILVIVLYIYYPVYFYRNTIEIKDLLNSGCEINTKTLAYTVIISLQACLTNVGAWKIDGSTFNIFEMALARFEVEDKLGRAQYLQETFLFANISVKIVLKMFFSKP